MTERGKSDSVSVAERAALRWLFTCHRGPIDRSALMDYYRRNGPTGGLSTVSRRGAAGRMYWRLVDKGLIDARQEELTAAGYEIGGGLG